MNMKLKLELNTSKSYFEKPEKTAITRQKKKHRSIFFQRWFYEIPDSVIFECKKQIKNNLTNLRKLWICHNNYDINLPICVLKKGSNFTIINATTYLHWCLLYSEHTYATINRQISWKRLRDWLLYLIVALRKFV